MVVQVTILVIDELQHLPLAGHDFSPSLRGYRLVAIEVLKIPDPKQCLGTLRYLRTSQILFVNGVWMFENFLDCRVSTNFQGFRRRIATQEQFIKYRKVLI